jgi:hypothetical protein
MISLLPQLVLGPEYVNFSLPPGVTEIVSPSQERLNVLLNQTVSPPRPFAASLAHRRSLAAFTESACV